MILNNVRFGTQEGIEGDVLLINWVIYEGVPGLSFCIKYE